MFIVRIKYVDEEGVTRRVYLDERCNFVTQRVDAKLFLQESNAATCARLICLNKSNYEGKVIKC